MKKNKSISQKLWQLKSEYFLVFSTVLFLTISGCSEIGVFNETVTDVDGNKYETVKIGDQVWMAENLKVTKYRNGDNINTPPKGVEDNWQMDGTSSNSQWYSDVWAVKDAAVNYKNDEKQRFNPMEDGPGSRGKYGLLYNMKAVNDSRCLCPEGYHMPTKEEFETLIKSLGGYEGTTPTFWDGDVAPKLMSITDWDLTKNHYKGNNESGFNALPSGYKSGGDYPYGGIGEVAVFWTSTIATEIPDSNSTLFKVPDNFNVNITNHHLTSVEMGGNLGTGHGFSVRCIKDYPGMVVVQNKPVNNPSQTELENNIQPELDTILKSGNTIDTTAANVQKTYYNGCGYSYESKEDCMTQCGAFGRTCTEGAATGEIIKASSKKE